MIKMILSCVKLTSAFSCGVSQQYFSLSDVGNSYRDTHYMSGWIYCRHFKLLDIQNLKPAGRRIRVLDGLHHSQMLRNFNKKL